jgi:transposase
MAMMAAQAPTVIGGIDTHKDLHTAAVVDAHGAVLGVESFATTRAGYDRLLSWMAGFGALSRVGVESSGSFGAGVTRRLARAGIPVLEVAGQERARRRGRGKDDAMDAVAAARAALDDHRVSAARTRTGEVEALRVLRTTRAGAVKARRAALQQLHNTIVEAPEELRDATRGLTRMALLRTVAAWRPDRAQAGDPLVAARLAMRSIARRILELGDEIADLEQLITPLVNRLAPALLQARGIGTEIAGQLLVTAGDNPQRLSSESGFAMLCGVAPIPASSGKTQRHRLNRGGDRAANRALHMAVVSRLRMDPRTRAYATRRLAEGRSKREVMRCLKRYLAREVFRLLVLTPSSANSITADA